MINASKEFKEKLKKGGRIVNYADITLSNGTVLHLTYKDFMASGGCTIEDKTTDGKFGVGFTIGKTVKIMIANHDERFSDYDFYNSIINLYVAMQLDDGRIEKIRKGVYYSMVPATSGEVIEISAVDGMWKLDKDYSVVNTTYPATLQTIITDICSVCGIPIGFRHFDNMSFMVNERPYNLTCRRVLSCAAQIAGYNARIDNDGYMQLVWYNVDIALTYISGGNFRQYPHDTVIDGGDFKNYRADTIVDGGLFTDEQPEHIYSVKSLNVCTDDVQITGVRVEKKAASTEEEDTTILFGEEGYVIEVKENPLTLHLDCGQPTIITKTEHFLALRDWHLLWFSTGKTNKSACLLQFMYKSNTLEILAYTRIIESNWVVLGMESLCVTSTALGKHFIFCQTVCIFCHFFRHIRDSFQSFITPDKGIIKLIRINLALVR